MHAAGVPVGDGGGVSVAVSAGLGLSAGVPGSVGDGDGVSVSAGVGVSVGAGLSVGDGSGGVGVSVGLGAGTGVPVADGDTAGDGTPAPVAVADGDGEPSGGSTTPPGPGDDGAYACRVTDGPGPGVPLRYSAVCIAGTAATTRAVTATGARIIFDRRIRPAARRAGTAKAGTARSHRPSGACRARGTRSPAAAAAIWAASCCSYTIAVISASRDRRILFSAAIDSVAAARRARSSSPFASRACSCLTISWQPSP
jgi:hypothetical protein